MEMDCRSQRNFYLNPLRKIVGVYGDKQIAEEILTLYLPDEYDYFDLRILSKYFTIDSIPLIKKGLSSEDYKLRAWSVWQLRKLNYKWEDGEMEKLLKDNSWYVRTNAKFARTLQ
jgi:hypothetical protein